MATDGWTAGAIVITGASTGIGEACALRFDKMGWRVFAGVRKEADAQRLKAGASERLTPLLLDVTDQSQIEAAAASVREATGGAGLQALVNNAGVSVNGPLEFLTPEDVRKQLEVNVVGQVAMTQAFLPLIRVGQGRIVNIGSIAGKFSTPFLGPYSASKHAMEAISDALRQELRPWGIHVALVEPGSIKTEIWEKGQRDADEYLKNAPEQAMQLYGKAFNALREAAREFEGRGIPADRVAQAVAHAVTSSRPHALHRRLRRDDPADHRRGGTGPAAGPAGGDAAQTAGQGVGSAVS